jgi:hypothetical protein
MGVAQDVPSEMNPSPSASDTNRIVGPGNTERAPVPSALLKERLEVLRRRHVSVAVLTGLSMTTVICLEILAVAMFMDWWLELAWSARLLSLILQAGLFGWLTLSFIVRPIIHQPDEDELALMVEKARPEFRSRLIAAVQLPRPGAVPPGASPSLAEAVIAEAEAMARPSDFREIVRMEGLKRFGLMAVVIPTLALGGFLYGRHVCTDLLKRVFLSNVPVPRKTRILVPDGNRVVGVGDTIRLDCFVQGMMPSQGNVEVKYRTRRVQTFPLDQNRDNHIHFGRLLENVQESFTYRFHLGDGVSAEHEIKAVPRPMVESVECEQVFPGYTGLPSTSRQLGDLSLLAGSVLKLKITATKDLQNAGLILMGLGRELPLALDPAQPRKLQGVFTVPARGLSGFQIHMVDRENMESHDEAVYRVDILADKVPVVRLTYPDRKEELVTRNVTLMVAFEATDDFQIRKVRLKFKTATLDQNVEKSLELELAGESPQKLRRRFEWKVSDSLPGVVEGSLIEYWMEVEDNNDATGPGIGASEHQLLRVVSEAEKRADLLNRAGDYLGSINDVALDQEKLNQSLGALIRAKAGLR